MSREEDARREGNDLLIVAASEGRSERVRLIVAGLIVQAPDGRRFVVRDVSEPHPKPNTMLGEAEFAERVKDGTFLALPGWRARAEHLVVILHADLWRAAREAGIALEPAEVASQEDGGWVFLVHRARLSEFRRQASAAWLKHVRAMLRRQGPTQMGREQEALRRKLMQILAVALRGAEEETEASLLWVLLQEAYAPERVAAALHAARVVTQLDPPELAKRLEERRHEFGWPSSRSLSFVRRNIRTPFLDTKGTG